MPELPDDQSPAPLERLWKVVTDELRADLSAVTFHIWIEPLTPLVALDGVLYLRAPDATRSWVAERYAPLVTAALRRRGLASSVEIVDRDWSPPQSTARGTAPAEPDDALNPRYTFDQFVICEGNRLAHAAALAVAEMPAQTYNPLFLHGRPGLGKTHLLHAIGNYVRAYGLGLSVRYATLEDFTGEFVRAIRHGDTRAFRDRFRHADVLLIDDVQFLADKAKTEEEFFHTFNALYESGSQLVISSDRPPHEIGALETRLRERFEHGLVAPLEPPSLEARLAILQKRARLDSLDDVTQETLAEIARRVRSSVRTLEGALIRVVAYASLEGRTPTPDLAGSILDRLYPTERPTRCTLADIKSITAETLGVPAPSLEAHDRRPKLSFARQVAMYLARELTDESLPAIGASFGGRNHTTVLHAHRRVAKELSTDQHTASLVDSLRTRLTAAGADRPR